LIQIWLCSLRVLMLDRDQAMKRRGSY
jgi:hypothetical protein